LTGPDGIGSAGSPSRLEEESMKISDNSVVSIHYKLTNDEGVLIDTSEGSDPLVYMHGTDSLIPGLERELTGKAAGEQFQVRILPEDGYGLVDEELIDTIDRSVLDGIDDIQVGMQLESKDPEGDIRYVIVQALTESTVTLNANAPLAGHVLNFDVSIDGVREALPEEIDHGHPH
jgi:FKBP-type peptidyl-prolyl cis-trans isomerase SlyD